MIPKTQLRNGLRAALLWIVLLCTACGAKGAKSTAANPLLALLDEIPQDPIGQAEEYIYFADSSAIEAAYDATRPPDAEVFADLSERDDAYAVWWAVMTRVNWPLQESWFALETMPETVGFSMLEVDQVIQFGAPPGQGTILTGSFDADAIRDAYQANLDYASHDYDGTTVWCQAEGCERGALLDVKQRMRENPFGGNLGQRKPMVISEDRLMASADLQTVLAHQGAVAGKVSSLADDPGYHAAVSAVSKDALIVQATIAGPPMAQRLADSPPIDERLLPEMSGADLDAMLQAYQELPPYELLILADTVTQEEQIARLGIVYGDAETAESAASVLLDRLASHTSAQFRRPLAEIFADGHVADPRYDVHQEADVAVLVLEFPARKASTEEILQMRDLTNDQRTATPPGWAYRLFYMMMISGDTSWLSTAPRAELDAQRPQVGTLVGLEMTMGLSDIADGVIDQANFGGIVIVELDDGTTARAVWDKSLGDDLVGGMKLQIVPTKDPDVWRVLRIVERP